MKSPIVVLCAIVAFFGAAGVVGGPDLIIKIVSGIVVAVVLFVALIVICMIWEENR